MKNEKYLSCSQVGRAAFCPHSLKLGAEGVKSSKDSIERMARGEQLHEQFNQEITQDKRCFVATACFGSDDLTTQFFRDYRDQYVKRTFSGRLFISMYYKASPYLVSCMESIPGAKSLAKRVLCCLKRRLERLHD